MAYKEKAKEKEYKNNIIRSIENDVTNGDVNGMRKIKISVLQMLITIIKKLMTKQDKLHIMIAPPGGLKRKHCCKFLKKKEYHTVR